MIIDSSFLFKIKKNLGKRFDMSVFSDMLIIGYKGLHVNYKLSEIIHYDTVELAKKIKIELLKKLDVMFFKIVLVDGTFKNVKVFNNDVNKFKLFDNCSKSKDKILILNDAIDDDKFWFIKVNNISSVETLETNEF